MLSASGIGIFIDALPVESSESVCIRRKVGGHPVEDYSDTGFVQLVDQIHKIRGGSVSGCGCIIARHLITPGSVERMLCDSHKLYMGISHLLEIPYDPVRKLPVIVETVLGSVGVLHERTYMALINCHGFFVPVFFISGAHPLFVFPFKRRQVCGDGCGAGAELRLICIGICFVEFGSVRSIDQKLVHLAGAYPFDEELPDPHGTELFHLAFGFVPAVPGSYYMNGKSIRCPYGKIISLSAVLY